MADITIDNGLDNPVYINKEATINEIQSIKDDVLGYKVEASNSSTSASEAEERIVISESNVSNDVASASSASASANNSAGLSLGYAVESSGYRDQSEDYSDSANASAINAEASSLAASGFSGVATSAKDIAVTQSGIAVAQAVIATDAKADAVNARLSAQADRDGTSQLLAEFKSIYHGSRNNTEVPNDATVSDGDLYYNSDENNLMLRNNGLWAIAVPSVTDLYTKTETDTLLSTKLDEALYTALDIKNKYESNLDTNAYTDDDLTKVGYIDDLVVESDSVKQMRLDTNEPSGYIRENTDTMGTIELCPIASEAIVHKIDNDSTYTELSGQTLFGDGITTLADRTLIVYPSINATISIYIEGNRYEVSDTKSVILPNQSGLQFIYWELIAGVPELQASMVLDNDYFEERPIVSLVYGNAMTAELIDFADERHGISMDGVTHRYLHLTEGARYHSGMGLTGLSDNGTTHGQVDSGIIYDEDIVNELPAQTDLSFYYMTYDDGTGLSPAGNYWNVEADTNMLAKIGADGYAQVNAVDNGEYSLVSMDDRSGDYAIMFIIATNNKVSPYAKMLGQEAYARETDARAAIEDEVSRLSLAGLPSPEYVFVCAYVIDKDGEIKYLSDGSPVLDLRQAKLGGSSGSSGVVTSHLNLSDREAIDSHPASAITNIATGNLIATDVQSALDEIQTELDTISAIVEW